MVRRRFAARGWYGLRVVILRGRLLWPSSVGVGVGLVAVACSAFSADTEEPVRGLDAGTAADGAEAGPTDAGTVGPSCVGLAVSCGGDGGQSCCASKVIIGGTFNRSNEVSAPATVSDFRLDVYEVTVGRFRAFVKAGQGNQTRPPAVGDGAHPKIPSSGWDASYNASLATSTSDLEAGVNCSRRTWTDAPSANETLPINCVTWFEASAFCAWDGGRLPTEAEFNYAAAGGALQREYPWGTGIDDSKALVCANVGTCFDFLPVGTKSPPGDGRWGQADLAGGVSEWLLDRYAAVYSSPCVDCAQLTGGTERVIRGGSRGNGAATLRSSSRSQGVPTVRYASTGVRCARRAE